MKTLSGKLLTMENDEAPTVNDMAIGLSRTNRFGGQTLVPWNDAQHSLVCRRIAYQLGLPDRMQLIMLLHDAHEMITGDACRPFKPKGMSLLQDSLDRRIYASLGLSRPGRAEKVWQDHIDNSALLAEAMVLTPEATFTQACEDAGGLPFSTDVDVVKMVRLISDPALEWEIQVNFFLEATRYDCDR